MSSSFLNTAEYNSYYQGYIDNVNNQNLLTALNDSFENILAFYESIPELKWDYKYAEGKWTVKEVVQHLIDTERVFTFRALCISRGDQNSLPGFDENIYAANSLANSRSKQELIEDYTSVRAATVSLFKSFSEEILRNMGVANDSPLSVRASGFIIVGHEKHHCNVIKERYL